MGNVKWPEEVGLNTEAKMTAALATPDTDEAFRLKSIQRKLEKDMRTELMSPAEHEVKNTEEFLVNGQHWAVAN